MMLQEFQNYYRKKRNEKFIKPYDLAYNSFIDLKYDEKKSDFFINNASEIVTKLREKSWENFLIAEKIFSADMYKYLADAGTYDNLDNKQAIYKFIDTSTPHFYELSLSNTQSRRSRAGTEFEAIVELIVMGSGISIDSQGSLASGIFESHNLGKAVDLVSPGVAEYDIQKRQVTLISCKTTLRERWAEVVEEKDRTGASEIFLATLDETISNRTLKTLENNNIVPVTTKNIKAKKYIENSSVITFEELLKELEHKNNYWTKEKYTDHALKQKLAHIELQKNTHKDRRPFVYNYYDLLEKHFL